MRCAHRAVFLCSFICNISLSWLHFFLLLLQPYIRPGWVLLAFNDSDEETLTWYESHFQQRNAVTIELGDLSRVYRMALYYTVLSIKASAPIVLREEEVTYSTLVLCTGMVLQSILVGQISNLILASDSTWARHKRRVEMFKAYMRHAKLGPAVRARVMSYMSFLWETSKGLDERELLGNLPPRLQDEIRVSTHQTLVDKMSLFAGASEKLISKIMQKLEEHIYLQGDTIVKRGDEGHEVLLINSGCVRIPRTRLMRRTIYLYEGDHFGEVATIFGERHSFSAIAHTHCRIYSLDQDLLEELCEDHPPCIEALVKSMEYYHQHMPDMTSLVDLRTRIGLTNLEDD